MTGLKFGIHATIVGCLLLAMPASMLAQKDLTKNQIEILETGFLPAWRMGNNLEVLTSLSKAIRNMNAEQLAALDVMLIDQDIPESGQLLLQTRLSLLQQGYGKKLPRAGTRELVQTLEFIDADRQSLMNEAMSHIKALDKLNPNSGFDQFDKLLWNSHVLTQKLQSSLLLVQYAAAAAKAGNRNISKLTEQEQELLNTDFEVFADELKHVQKLLQEHEIVARIDRLQHATKALGQEAADRKEKYLAAWAVNQDTDVIRALLDQEMEFTLEELQSEDLIDSIQQIANRGLELAGPELLEKSRLLHEGMHWWYRGRYGMGTEAFGLLKSPDALTSDEAAFALMMPEQPPTPTPPQEDSRYQVPEIDRRHHYIWAWEYQSFGSRTMTSQKVIDHRENISQITVMSRFY